MWSKKWKQLLIWLSGYINFIAFAIIGGYTIIKSEDEELKKTAKQTFIITLIFTAISAFFSLYNQCLGLFNVSNSDFYKFSNVCTTLATIAKIIVYAVYMILTFLQKDEPNTNIDERKDEE